MAAWKDEYVKIGNLGVGSYATVVRARNKTTGMEVAMKIIDKGRLNNDKLIKSLELEIAILREFQHPNMVELFDMKQTVRHYYLIMECCVGGDLQHFIKMQPGKRLTEGQARRFMGHLSLGLAYLTAKHLIHRDLKPQNLLLTSLDFESAVLKIADFGFARHLGEENLAETMCGSPLYMAPEILQERTYDAKADLWSVGTILYEMVVGRPPFGGANRMDLLRNIRQKQLSVPKGVELTPPCIQTLKMLLQRDPLNRAAFETFFGCDFIRQGVREVEDFNAAAAAAAATDTATEGAVGSEAVRGAQDAQATTEGCAPPSSPFSDPLVPLAPPAAPTGEAALTQTVATLLPTADRQVQQEQALREQQQQLVIQQQQQQALQQQQQQLHWQQQQQVAQRTHAEGRHARAVSDVVTPLSRHSPSPHHHPSSAVSGDSPNHSCVTFTSVEPKARQREAYEAACESDPLAATSASLGGAAGRGGRDDGRGRPGQGQHQQQQPREAAAGCIAASQGATIFVTSEPRLLEPMTPPQHRPHHEQQQQQQQQRRERQHLQQQQLQQSRTWLQPPASPYLQQQGSSSVAHRGGGGGGVGRRLIPPTTPRQPPFLPLTSSPPVSNRMNLLGGRGQQQQQQHQQHQQHQQYLPGAPPALSIGAPAHAHPAAAGGEPPGGGLGGSDDDYYIVPHPGPYASAAPLGRAGASVRRHLFVGSEGTGSSSHRRAAAGPKQQQQQQQQQQQRPLQRHDERPHAPPSQSQQGSNSSHQQPQPQPQQLTAYVEHAVRYLQVVEVFGRRGVMLAQLGDSKVMEALRALHSSYLAGHAAVTKARAATDGVGEGDSDSSSYSSRGPGAGAESAEACLELVLDLRVGVSVGGPGAMQRGGEEEEEKEGDSDWDPRGAARWPGGGHKTREDSLSEGGGEESCCVGCFTSESPQESTSMSGDGGLTQEGQGSAPANNGGRTSAAAKASAAAATAMRGAPRSARGGKDGLGKHDLVRSFALALEASPAELSRGSVRLFGEALVLYLKALSLVRKAVVWCKQVTQAVGSALGTSSRSPSSSPSYGAAPAPVSAAGGVGGEQQLPPSSPSPSRHPLEGSPSPSHPAPHHPVERQVKAWSDSLLQWLVLQCSAILDRADQCNGRLKEQVSGKGHEGVAHGGGGSGSGSGTGSGSSSGGKSATSCGSVPLSVAPLSAEQLVLGTAMKLAQRAAASEVLGQWEQGLAMAEKAMLLVETLLLDDGSASSAGGGGAWGGGPSHQGEATAAGATGLSDAGGEEGKSNAGGSGSCSLSDVERSALQGYMGTFAKLRDILLQQQQQQQQQQTTQPQLALQQGQDPPRPPA